MVWGDVNIYSKRLFVWRTPRIYSLLPRRKPLLSMNSCQSKWKMRWSIIDHCITNLQFSTFTQLVIYMQCEIWNVLLGLLLAPWGKSNSLTASRCNWFRDSVRIIYWCNIGTEVTQAIADGVWDAARDIVNCTKNRGRFNGVDKLKLSCGWYWRKAE